MINHCKTLYKPKAAYLTPFLPRFLFKDLGHLFFELVKVVKLREVFFFNAKLIKEGLVELRLNAADRHEAIVLGAISLIEVDAGVKQVLASWFAPLGRAVLGEEPGADIGGALHHVAVDHLQEEVAQVEGEQHLALA